MKIGFVYLDEEFKLEYYLYKQLIINIHNVFEDKKTELLFISINQEIKINDNKIENVYIKKNLNKLADKILSKESKITKPLNQLNCSYLFLINSFFKKANAKQILIRTANKVDFKDKTDHIISLIDYENNTLKNTTNHHLHNFIPQIFTAKLDNQQKQEIIDSYCDGRNYFIASIKNNLDEILNLLQSFSGFKKWLKSNFKLILLNFNSPLIEVLKTKLETYKYREDIVIVDAIQEQQFEKLIEASYCFINYSIESEFPYLELIAAQKQVSIISIKVQTIENYFNENIFYSEANELSNAMIELYKNESLKSKLIKDAFAFFNDNFCKKSNEKFSLILNDIIAK